MKKFTSDYIFVYQPYISATLKFLSVLTVFFLGLTPGLYAQITVNGSGNYSTIQEAVNNASAGATIAVPAGVYNENITIAKSLTITGAGRTSTTIVGQSGGEATVGVNGPLTGFSLTGFTILGLDNGNPGIENGALFLRGTLSSVTIADNEIIANGDLGFATIYGSAINAITVSGNIFSGKTFTGDNPNTGDQFVINNVARAPVFFNGGGSGSRVSNLTFTDNQITAIAGTSAGGNLLVNIEAENATIKGNTFSGSTGGAIPRAALRLRGTGHSVTCNTFLSSCSNCLHIERDKFNEDPLSGATPSSVVGLASQNTFPDGGYYVSPSTSFTAIYPTSAQAQAVVTGGQTVAEAHFTATPASQTVDAGTTTSLTAVGCDGGMVSWSPGGASGASFTTPAITATTTYTATCTPAGGGCSFTATATIVVPTVTGNFEGFMQTVNCSSLTGWVWDKGKPNVPLQVGLYEGNNLITIINADKFRQDLLTANKGNGVHAYNIPTPEELKNGSAHVLTARVLNSAYQLKDSPKVLNCGVPNPAPVAPAVSPLSATVNVAYTSSQLPAFTDADPLTYGLTGLPNNLTFDGTTRVISGTPVVAGTFLLNYTASDGTTTSSASVTLTVTGTNSGTVSGNFEGFLQTVNCGVFTGWVYDKNQPNAPITVEFFEGGNSIGVVEASNFRQDLKTAGKGNGFHAFSVPTPAGVKTGTTRVIGARVLNSTYQLKDSPKTLNCPSPAPARVSAPSAEGNSLKVSVLGNPIADQVQVEVQGAEEQTLRLQINDAQGRIVAEHIVQKAGAIERQTLRVGNQPAGLLFLRVSVPGQIQTLKLLKP
ncbi:putative Ig domain-containing protein [Larkinella rosea]|nr:putative Ig domain-containing protein [Larkinella rosea]